MGGGNALVLFVGFSPHRIGKYTNVVALSLHKNVTGAKLVRDLAKR